MERWSGILFSDESRFSLSFNDGRTRVRRRSGERFIGATITEHERHGGGSVLVWGGIRLNNRTPLYVIEGNLTAQRYRDEILQPIVLPALKEMELTDLFQDDNARHHRGRIVNEFMRQHDIERLPWPANSPDLAPIEHIWDKLAVPSGTTTLLPSVGNSLLSFSILNDWPFLRNVFVQLSDQCEGAVKHVALPVEAIRGIDACANFQN